MVAQAFKDNDRKHYAAIAVAMVPPVADYLYTQVTGALSLANLQTAVQNSGLNEYTAEITQMIKDAGVMWNGVPAAKSGAIIIGILLGTMVTFVIDKRLDKVGITALMGIYSLLLWIHPQRFARILSTFTFCNRIFDNRSFIFHIPRRKKYMVQGA